MYMLMNASQIVGFNVVTEQNQLVDQVSDVVVDPKKKKLVAIVLSKNEMTGLQVVPFEKVKNIAQNQVVVSSEKDIKPFSAIVKNSSPENNTLTDKTVVTNKGDKIGELSDVSFDTSNGNVKKLIVQKNGQPQEIKIKDIQAADEVVIIKEKKQSSEQHQNTQTQQMGGQQSNQQVMQMQQKGGQRTSQNGSQVLTVQENSNLKKEIKRVTNEAKQSLIQLFKG